MMRTQMWSIFTSRWNYINAALGHYATSSWSCWPCRALLALSLVPESRCPTHPWIRLGWKTQPSKLQESSPFPILSTLVKSDLRAKMQHAKGKQRFLEMKGLKSTDLEEERSRWKIVPLYT